ncbi:MAG: alpha-amylase family glycosyl hydrolase [Ignavibacterium sp.]|nr:alpha-amylase family glycosyl hydrolase [Ignavibacterium sp.]
MFGQSDWIKRIEPPNWWTGFKNDTLQLLVYGNNISNLSVELEKNSVQLLGVKKAESPNYLFIDLLIPKIDKYLEFELKFFNRSKDTSIIYTLLEREKGKRHQGFDNNDVIYLIMADRFCDGNPLNNKIGDSLDKYTEFDLDGRKGGDIEGIISKLDYLKELGITTLWITPMLENNMYMSYHGYAATDLYKIDPRFGSNELYKKLVDEAHKKDLKIIMDHVSNHIGINHWWIKDLPFKNWINGEPKNHLPANHNKQTFPDIYSPGESVRLTWEGWFTDYMPDLNYKNPYLRKYMIQNTIWWIEYLGIDGIREDTYPYVNQYYMSDWAKSIFNEYPNFNIVAEVWTGETPFLAFYQRNNKFGSKINSYIPSITDFAFADAIRDFLSGKRNLNAIFDVLAMDYLYYQPEMLVTFIDNHDIARGLYLANEDIEKFKLALTILLTTRGIPKILYGSEIGLVGDNRHGTIRTPFPGGFKNDSRNAFQDEGRTTKEKDIFNFTKRLLQLRNRFDALKKGSLIHFYPFENLYVYFRILKNQKIMIVINANDKEMKVNLNNYKETLKESKNYYDLLSDKFFQPNQDNQILIPSKSSKIFLISK